MKFVNSKICLRGEGLRLKVTPKEELNFNSRKGVKFTVTPKVVLV
jgi:hypothetical protein